MSLEKHRNTIDSIDRQIVSLLNRRAGAAREIGLIKAAAGLPVVDNEREGRVIAAVVRGNQGILPGEAMSRIYEQILRESRAIQSAMAAEKPEREEIERV